MTHYVESIISVSTHVSGNCWSNDSNSHSYIFKASTHLLALSLTCLPAADATFWNQHVSPHHHHNPDKLWGGNPDPQTGLFCRQVYCGWHWLSFYSHITYSSPVLSEEKTHTHTNLNYAREIACYIFVTVKKYPIWVVNKSWLFIMLRYAAKEEVFCKYCHFFLHSLLVINAEKKITWNNQWMSIFFHITFDLEHEILTKYCWLLLTEICFPINPI